MTFSFKFAREMGEGTKSLKRRRRTFFFYPFSSFSTQFPRLRSEILVGVGVGSEVTETKRKNDTFQNIGTVLILD